MEKSEKKLSVESVMWNLSKWFLFWVLFAIKCFTVATTKSTLCNRLNPKCIFCDKPKMGKFIKIVNIDTNFWTFSTNNREFRMWFNALGDEEYFRCRSFLLIPNHDEIRKVCWIKKLFYRNGRSIDSGCLFCHIVHRLYNVFLFHLFK